MSTGSKSITSPISSTHFTWKVARTPIKSEPFGFLLTVPRNVNTRWGAILSLQTGVSKSSCQRTPTSAGNGCRLSMTESVQVAKASSISFLTCTSVWPARAGT